MTKRLGLRLLFTVGLASCSASHGTSRRFDVSTVGDLALTEAMMTATASRLQDVVNPDKLVDEARHEFRGWVNLNVTTAGDPVRITFRGPVMSNHQQVCVDYPEIYVHYEMHAQK